MARVLLLAGLALCALLGCVAAEGATDFKACYTPPTDPIDCIELTPRPDRYVDLENDLAESLDWRNRNGKDLTTAVMNQHIPHYCGACWAFGTLSALSDRIKISRQGRWPEVQLSPQVLLNCGAKEGYDVGCNGGYAHATYDYAHKFGITDVTCAAYQAKQLTCDSEDICKNCAHDGSCFAVQSPTKYHVSEYGQVSGERQMMAEIQERGPIACGISVTPEFLTQYKGGVFEDKTHSMQIRHVVSLVGWGEEDGKKYWVGRNSWGTYWGENGYFRIARGVNNMNLESDCYWAVPKFDRENLSRGMAEADVDKNDDAADAEHDADVDYQDAADLDDVDISEVLKASEL